MIYSFLVYYTELIVKICLKKYLKSLNYQGEDTICIGLIQSIMEYFTKIIAANSYSTFHVPGIFHVSNN